MLRVKTRVVKILVEHIGIAGIDLCIRGEVHLAEAVVELILMIWLTM